MPGLRELITTAWCSLLFYIVFVGKEYDSEQLNVLYEKDAKPVLVVLAFK